MIVNIVYLILYVEVGASSRLKIIYRWIYGYTYMCIYGLYMSYCICYIFILYVIIMNMDVIECLWQHYL